MQSQGVKVFQEPQEDNSVIGFILSNLLILGLTFFLLSLLMRKMGGAMGGGLGGVGQSKAKVYMEKETGVTFADVAGQDEAKESLQEIIDFLHNPQKYAAIGAKAAQGRGCCWWAPPAPARRFSPRLWQGRPRCRSSPSPVRILWRCSWA